MDQIADYLSANQHLGIAVYVAGLAVAWTAGYLIATRACDAVAGLRDRLAEAARRRRREHVAHRLDVALRPSRRPDRPETS